MVKLVVGVELPLILIENQHYVSYGKKYLQSRYVVVNRNTLRSDTIQYFTSTKQQLIIDLQNMGGVISLISDIWEGINKIVYIVATAH